MAKTLKICLAMGGGVSLGSFSGSALTEALKLLILYGQDAEGNKYDDVVVDGMSGASAGAIALTVMLKTLIDYESMMYLLKDVTHDSLIDEISMSYFEGNNTEAANFDKIEELKALQVAQKIQEELWVNRLDAVSLFGNKKIKNFKPNIHESFSLLDRGLLEKLAKEFIIEPKFENLNKVKVLDQVRVPFACSLTNLLPIEIKKDEKGLPQLEKNVIQSVGAQNHTELRIIDFVFKKDKLNHKETDKRWLQFSDTDDVDNRHFDLNSDKAWAIICSSVLACGAFPIAFEPVILKRYKEEFDGEGENPNGQWPIQFNKLNHLYTSDSVTKKSSVFNETIENEMSYKSFNFPYVDGGTFNNEPIREAYRIGAFQDFGDHSNKSDRLILFVDPIVRTEKYQTFLQSSLIPVSMKAKAAQTNGELSKFVGVTSSLINSLKNQGRVKEEHKISDVRENLKLRNTIFNYLENNDKLGKSLTVEILDTAYVKIETNLKDDIIPLGTRDVVAYFKNELIKTCVKENKPDSSCLVIAPNQFEKLISEIERYKREGKKFDFQKLGYKILGIKTIEDENLFANTVFKIIFDFSLNTDGKNEKAERVAILPINSEKEIISLPGEEVSAFGGFASVKARQYAFHYGKLSTLNSLAAVEGGFRKRREGQEEAFPFITSEKEAYIKGYLEKKINKIKFFDSLNAYQEHIRKDLVKLGLKRVLVLVKHVFGRGMFFSALIGSFAGLMFRLPSRLNWFMKFTSGMIYKFFLKKKIEVTHVNLLPVTISILSKTKLSTKARITATDEKSHKIKMILNESADSDGNESYQYIFQAYRGLYRKDIVDTKPDEKPETKVLMGTTYTLEPEKVEKIALTLQKKVRLPNIDGNLSQGEMTKELQANFEKIIYRIRIGKHELPSINKALEAENDMLRHSFLNIEYHLNPLIEIDIDQLDKGWYFKENTEAMHKKFLRTDA
ncbi:patatin-like phospholipase family protein [uncultured Psychroserpens sp.]|uniref:patatin-like phospholipase family protein n=1 Tax=uncultured Psychroserpens sp. TaxID=255436 RepID=UPI002609284E|nr:patatin-like phospholipase family protein [uncultured Psychroserpens sp.]